MSAPWAVLIADPAVPLRLSDVQVYLVPDDDTADRLAAWVRDQWKGARVAVICTGTGLDLLLEDYDTQRGVEFMHQLDDLPVQDLPEGDLGT